MLHSVTALLILLCAVAFPLWSSWAQDSARSPSPRYGGTYRRPLSNNPSTLDPALIADIYGFVVAQQIFDGLVQYDGTLTIVPAIAESWKGSRDGLQWTFYLRKGVRFHTGREVTANDVIYSFMRLLDPKTGSKAAEVFSKAVGAKDFADGRTKTVRGFRIIDPLTLQIDLTEASAPFVANLAMGYIKIVPREIVGEAGAAFGAKPIGTGPFKFVSWKKDEEIVLESNPEYFSGRPFIDRLEYRIYPGAPMQKMLSDFERGGLEDTFVPNEELERVREDKRYQYVQRPILGTRFFGINTGQGPLANVPVRQALSHAIDREGLVRAIHKNRYKAASGFLPPGTYGYDPKLQALPFDPNRAKALLAGRVSGRKGSPPDPALVQRPAPRCRAGA
jgi:ABC-type transport system substrate-binding protein